MLKKLLLIIPFFILASVANAQTPPLYSTNSKYLGWAGTGGGTGNAQTITYSPALTSLTTGQAVSWIPSNANSGAATLNVNSLGAKSIVKLNGSALVANDLLTTAVATAIYDGTNFELLDPQAGGGANVGCSQLPALTGDTTTSAGSCATTTSKLNGTAFAGTNTHFVAFGASNIPVDSGIPDTAAGILAACTGCAPLASPALSGSPTAPTQTTCDNSTKIATTAYAGETCQVVETSGSPLSASAQAQTIWNNSSGAYVVDLPTPSANGPPICIGNYHAVAHAISFVPGTGVTIYYKGAGGTSGSSTGLVSGGAAGDYICVQGTDSTTYEAIGAGQGTWTNN